MVDWIEVDGPKEIGSNMFACFVEPANNRQIGNIQSMVLYLILLTLVSNDVDYFRSMLSVCGRLFDCNNMHHTGNHFIRDKETFIYSPH